MLADKGLPLTDENIFIAAACQEKGILFLEGKATLGVRKHAPKEAVRKSDACTVTVDGKAYAVEFKGGQAVVNGKAYAFSVADGIAAPAPAATAAAAVAPDPDADPAPAGGGTEIAAPVPGIILRITAQPGQALKAGDEILVMEAMKMEMPIKAPADCTVASIAVTQAQKINTGDILAHLS